MRITLLTILLINLFVTSIWAFSDEQICNAIYKAEGGSHTNHPYGILKHYKHTTPRQACLNTIRHNRAKWALNGSRGDFIAYLGHIYCPVGCNNDNGTNKYWITNVRRFLCLQK